MNFSFSASYIALWALVVFQGLLVLALLRQLAELRRLVEHEGLPGEDWLPAGSPAPGFVGLDSRFGRQVSSRDLDGRGAVILFLSPGCEVCKGLVGSLQQPATNGLPPIVAFCQGGEQPCANFVKWLDLEVPLLLEGAEEVATRYGVSAAPTAVVVDGQRKIRAYGHPQNVEDLKRFVAHSLAEGSGGGGSRGEAATGHVEFG